MLMALSTTFSPVTKAVSEVITNTKEMISSAQAARQQGGAKAVVKDLARSAGKAAKRRKLGVKAKKAARKAAKVALA